MSEKTLAVAGVLAPGYTVLRATITRNRCTVELSIVGDFPNALGLLGYVEAMLEAVDNGAGSPDGPPLHIHISGAPPTASPDVGPL
jgi:hypothetical protein